MTSRSKFDVDLTRIVKRENVEYETPHGNVFDSYMEAVESFLAGEIQMYIPKARELFAYDVLDFSHADRQHLRDVLDYLDRD